MVIDSHTHAFPSAAIANPAVWADQRSEIHWKKLVLPENGSQSLQGWIARDQFLNSMRNEGIAGAVLLGWYWQSPDTCIEHNEEMADWIRKDPSCFRALASVHPSGPSPADAVEWALENRFSGFGELLPRIQDSSLSDSFWDELAGQSSDAGLFFNFHVTEPVGRPHLGRIETPFAEFETFIKRHPNLKIILSHWGGGLYLHELNPYVRKLFRNVYYDSAASPLLYDPEIFANAVQTIDPGKILFGSDFPLRLYPREERLSGWKRFLAEIKAQDLGEPTHSLILAENARRLFGFPR